MPETIELKRWQRGWSPLNLPPDHLYPGELLEGQVVDAQGVEVTPGGRLRWHRNQFRIHGPADADANVTEVKSVVEFVTEDYNQLLAFVEYDNAGTPEGRLFTLTDLDWSSLSPSQFAYGYELFSGKTWSEVTTESDAVDELTTDGIVDAVLVGDRLLISIYRASLNAPYEEVCVLSWDGTTLREIGTDAPEAAPSHESTGSGDLSSGTWSYYFTYYDPDTGLESMPSPILDVHETGDDNSFTIGSISGSLPKRVYRAYVADSGEDARGSDFLFVKELPAGMTAGSTEDLTGWTEQDTPSVLTVAANQLDATDLQDEDDAYLYSDEGADAIDLFEYRFSFTITSMEDGADVFLMGVTDQTAVAGDWTSGLAVWLTRVGSDYTLLLTDVTGAGLDAGDVETGTTYYVKWGRRERAWKSKEGGLFLEVYDNSDYSGDPLFEQTYIGADESTFQYIHLMNPWGSAGDTEKGTYQITDVVLNATTQFIDNTPEYALGENIAFDHAKPPRGYLLVEHNSRAFMAGCLAGSPSYEASAAGYYGNVLFWSELDGYRYWPGDNFVAVGDDTPITGIVSWRGQLVIFKEHSTWVLSGYNDFRLECIEPNVGAVAANAVASGPPGVMWVGVDGVWFYDGTSVRRLVPFGQYSPWDVDEVDDAAVPGVAFHNNAYYVGAVAPDDTLAVYEPSREVWTRYTFDAKDTDGATMGLRAFNYGANQAHVLTRMAWVSSGSQEITVLHPTAEITNADAEGTSHSDYFAPVQVTVALPAAPPGYEMIPMAVWVYGSWEEHGTASKRPDLFLNTDAAASDTEGDNAWDTTPECPQGGEVIGVPNGYDYDSSARTNAARRWYLQIEGEWAEDFELKQIMVRYRLRTARGA